MKISSLVSIIILATSCGSSVSPRDTINQTDSSLQVRNDTFIQEDPYCGDGICDPGETILNCYRDCKPKMKKQLTLKEIKPDYILIDPRPTP